MLEFSLMDGFAVNVLRLVAWANVGVAAALLVAIAYWLLSCGLDSRSHTTRGA